MPGYHENSRKLIVKSLGASSLTLLTGAFLFEASPVILGSAAILAGIGMYAKTKNNIRHEEAKMKSPSLHK